MSKNPPVPSPWQNPRAVRNAAADKMAAALLMGDQLRGKVRAGWALGTFCIELPTPGSLGALALAGFDFVVLDLEHSSGDLSTLGPLILAAQVCGLATLVRPCGSDLRMIGKVLDMGAHGVMVPHVTDADHARKVVAHARFPPRGSRGFSPLTKYDSLHHPLQELDAATYVVVQVEGRGALDKVAQIASVPGLDAVFVGPYDLALSLGVAPGSAQVFTAAQEIATAVAERAAVGIYIDDPTQCGVWAARRFALQCVSFDARMLSHGARAVAEQARFAVEEQFTNERPPESRR